jgi:hypothetical protein
MDVRKAQHGRRSRSNFMMEQPDDDFVSDEPLRVPQNRWGHVRHTAGRARQRTELFLRENPVPMILGALLTGLAIGLAIRYSARPEEKETRLEQAHWSLLSLPLLWPLLKSVKQKYRESAEAVREGVDRVRDLDIERYTKPIRKRWKSWVH